MIAALSRKIRQLTEDPALRRYLIERALHLVPAPPAFTPGRPPYLKAEDYDLGAPSAPPDFQILDEAPPKTPLRLDLPGAGVTLNPADPGALFNRDFDDLETRLAVHRFAWLPVLSDDLDPAWVGALWRAWAKGWGQASDCWEWHPYTAAERAINILHFAARHGLPAGAGDILAAHVPAIAARLEYGGPHYTGNHLANNGRGLYVLGLELNWPACADLGARILLTEAKRIFAPSGVLREESCHYHLLLTRNYISAWLKARRHDRPEQADLQRISAAALAVAPYFDLPGGMALVGDISPDCPPAALSGLLSLDQGAATAAGLSAADLAQAAQLAAQTPAVDADQLRQDGWLRGDFGEWAGLWHAAVQGWPFMPGHGHHDLGGFELHWRGLKLFIDPGRGRYGETGEAALYRSAAAHNVLRINGADPTAANRPYYTDDFRRRMGGAAPCLSRFDDGVGLDHHGFRRSGASTCRRRWTFAPSAMILTDDVQGRSAAEIERILITPWPVRLDGADAIIETAAGALRCRAEAPWTAETITAWTAYGQGAPATRLTTRLRASLPWTGRIIIEAI